MTIAHVTTCDNRGPNLDIGFSPVCVFRWGFKLLATENDLEHSLQLNGFSPVSVYVFLGGTTYDVHEKMILDILYK